MTRHSNDGLYKRCDCSRRSWSKCGHPWHFDYYRGKKFRFSLDKVARARGEQPPRSKGDAEGLRNRLRVEIDGGTFVDPNTKPDASPSNANAVWTVGDLIDAYIEKHVEKPPRREAAQKAMKWALGVFRRTEIPAPQGRRIRFELKPIKDVTQADIEALSTARHRAHREAVAVRQQWEAVRADLKPGQTIPRPPALPGVKGGEVGINRLLERVRHLFSWAVEKGHLERTPFRRDGVVVVKLNRDAETPRERRLNESADARQPGEEEQLLKHAGPHLRDLIEAGIATGCRVGELLNLQWADVKVRPGPRGTTRRVLLLPAGKTKTNRMREVPVGQRLGAILDMRASALAGVLGRRADEQMPACYVFGNECGERVKRINRAWNTCKLKAHGYTPQWIKGTNRLGPSSLAALKVINLKFHDLRREFGSRVLESGSTMVEARDLLGHTSTTQTNTYLAAAAKSLGLAIDRKEAHEAERALARERERTAQQEPENPCHTNDECDNAVGIAGNVPASPKVVTH